jgi:hypothetical protein
MPFRHGADLAERRRTPTRAPRTMTTIETVAVVIVLLLLAPVGDSVNKYFRSGGTYKPRWRKHKKR